MLMRLDARKLTCLAAKFQEEPIEPLREIAWRNWYMAEHFSFGVVKKCW